MNSITPVVLAGVTLAFCGCTAADGPVFATDATKSTGVHAGSSVEEQTRDMKNWQNSGQNMGIPNEGSSAPTPAALNNQFNPYGH